MDAQQTLSGSFVYDGGLREYILYIPAVYDPLEPAPLVLNLHGYGSNNLEQMFYGDFRPIADTAAFLVVHPNGLPDLLGNRAWNTFGIGTVDDLGFLSALIDTLGSQYSINMDRVYSTGMSNGGFMSYDLACFRSERIAAIASVTGSMITARLNSCAAGHPMPVMQIHGTADGTVNYAGGSGLVGIEELVTYWVQFNGCSAEPVIDPVPDVVTTDGCTAEHYLYTDGQAGSTVEFYKILDGGHTWPGSAFTIGVTNQDFNASREIWRFFSQYSLDQWMNGIGSLSGTEPMFTIGPNPSNDVFVLRFGSQVPRSVRVYDALGIAQGEIRSSATEVELRLDLPGTYVIVVEEPGRTSTRRAVKL